MSRRSAARSASRASCSAPAAGRGFDHGHPRGFGAFALGQALSTSSVRAGSSSISWWVTKISRMALSCARSGLQFAAHGAGFAQLLPLLGADSPRNG
jgi:hypothetical protein